jgi:SOS response regulatory protein OraA/RecX
MSFDIQVYLFLAIACFGSLAALIFTLKKSAVKDEKISQAKAETVNAVKQTEIANAQTKISDNAPTTRNDALKRLSQRSHSNR